MNLLKAALHGGVDLPKFVQSGLVSFTKAEVNRARSPLPLPLPVHLESVQVCIDYLSLNLNLSGNSGRPQLTEKAAIGGWTLLQAIGIV